MTVAGKMVVLADTVNELSAVVDPTSPVTVKIPPVVTLNPWLVPVTEFTDPLIVIPVAVGRAKVTNPFGPAAPPPGKDSVPQEYVVFKTFETETD